MFFILLQLEEGQKIVQLKVMAVEDDVLQVDILIPSENNRHKSLSQKLVADGFAKQMLATTGRFFVDDRNDNSHLVPVTKKKKLMPAIHFIQ